MHWQIEGGKVLENGKLLGELPCRPPAKSENGTRRSNPLAQAPKDTSIAYMKRSLILGLASTFMFFLGFVVAFVALVRY
jgi:hypothetical protein